MPDAFYTIDVWGWDFRGLQFRAYWNRPLTRPSLQKDPWCWYLLVGPFEVSGHRHKIWN